MAGDGLLINALPHRKDDCSFFRILSRYQAGQFPASPLLPEEALAQDDNAELAIARPSSILSRSRSPIFNSLSSSHTV